MANNLQTGPSALSEPVALCSDDELRFRELINSLPAAIYTTDATGKLTHFNPACVEFSGRTPMLGSDQWCVTWKLFHPDGTPMPHDECPMAVALKEGRVVQGAEAQAERPDGSRIWFAPYPIPLRDDAGKVVGGVNMLVDITALKQAEQAVRESEQRFRQTLSMMPAAVYCCDAQGRITYFNHRAAELWGRSPRVGDDGERFCGSHQMLLLDGTHLPHDECPMAVALREGRSFRNQEVNIRRSDGSVVTALVNIDPLRNEQGEVIGAINAFSDVSAIKRAQEELRVSQERLARDLRAMQRLHELSTRLVQEAGDLKSVMHEVLQAACEMLHASRGSAQVYDPSSGTLELTAWLGFDQAFADQFSVVDRQGISTCAALLRLGKRVLVADVANDPEYAEFANAAAMYNVRSAMSTPLLASDGKLLGVFTTYWEDAHEPNEHELRLFDLYVQQASRQIERRVAEQALRDSQEQLANEVRDLEILRQLSIRVAAASDRTAALNDVLDTAIPMVGAAKGNVQLYDAADDDLKIIAHRGFNDEFLEYFKSVPVGYSCCGAAMERRERVIIEDVYADERFRDLADIYAKHGFLAVQSTPLLTSDGRFLGMFSTHFAQPHRPSERDLRLLDQIAQQAGRIVERSLAEHDLRDRQNWLNGQREALEAAVNGAPLETSLAVLVRTAIEGVGRDARAGFYLANDEGTALHHVIGMPPDYAQAVDGFKVGPDSLACGLATATGSAVLTADVKDDPLWQPWLWMAEKFDYRACWSFPIHTAARKFVGTLAIYSRQPRQATERDQELATLLTHTASIIISRHKEAEVRKRAEQALRESESRFRTLADTAPAMLWITDQDGAGTFMSRGWYEFTGQDEEQALGSGWLEAVHPDDREEAWRRFTEAQARREPFAFDCRLWSVHNEYRWCIDAGRPRFDAYGGFQGYIGSVIDVHERKLAEQALRQADRRKDEFLATLAHELRNPLAPIRNSLHILRLAGTDDPATRQVHEVMERQINHMVRLVDDLLEVSRITSGKIELRTAPIEIAGVVRSAVEISQPLVEAGQHQLAITMPTEPLLVEGDAVRLSQVLANLINNAAKYTEPGGQIWLAVSAAAGKVEISVRDNGIGIAPNLLPHVFDMFSQADHDHKRAQGGLGIGLALAKRLVEMHGGQIEAKSAGAGQGSEFTIRLPLAQHSKSRVTGQGIGVASVGNGAKTRILVVDDNKDAAVSLGMLLRMMGNDVQTVSDGTSALAAISPFRPSIVLLDIGMPGMSGYQVARRIRALPEAEGIVLVAVTGYGQQEDRDRTRDAGFDFHLVKPIDADALASLLRECSGAVSAMSRC